MPSGILSAALLLVAWLISLFSLLPLDLSQGPMWLVPLVVGVRTALQTGLFITAHDAMHGHLFPSSPRLNHLLGAMLLFFMPGCRIAVAGVNINGTIGGQVATLIQISAVIRPQASSAGIAASWLAISRSPR
jgi:hypothetical protein